MIIENVDLTIIKAMPYIIYTIVLILMLGMLKIIEGLSLKTKTKNITNLLVIVIFIIITIVIDHNMNHDRVASFQYGVSYKVLEHKMEKKDNRYVMVDLRNGKTYDASEIDYDLYLKCNNKKISWYVSSERFNLFELKLDSSKIESTSLYCPDYE